MSQNFGSGLRPVEIPHPDATVNTSTGTTPTFSPAKKPTPLVGSWADIGWDKHGEPNSATMGNTAAPSDTRLSTGATPLLPSGVSAFEGRSDTPPVREGTDEYLNNLLTETAKLTAGDESDPDEPPKRANTPPPMDSATSKPSTSTYSRPSLGDDAAQGPHRTSYGGASFGPMYAPPQQQIPMPHFPHHQHSPHHLHQHHHQQHHSSYQPQYPPFPPNHHATPSGFYPPYGHAHLHYQHTQHHSYHPGNVNHYPGYGMSSNSPRPHNAGYHDAPYDRTHHTAMPTVPQPAEHTSSQISKFTPPPPPNVALANELAATDSDTPPSKVGDVLFSLGRRWVQKVETWLAAYPKERPNAPCPAAEQYATIETWLEKLNAWYEANFNGRKISGGRGRGSGTRGGRGGRGRGSSPNTASQSVPDEQPSFGTAW